MRLTRLELIAFGHFRDKVLVLERDAGVAPIADTPMADGAAAETGVPRRGAGPLVHLVYGDNEAGKSTALRAIRALMYGVPQQTDDAFLHAQADLRIGAEWAIPGEPPLYVMRRKGRKSTLLDRDGNPLDDSAWQQRLGGVDEALFRAMFGLNHETLRQGAQQLLAGEGKAAESLFGASMGTGEVRRVLKELARDADELYTPKSRTKRINQEVAEVKRIRAQLTTESTSPAAYAEREQALKQERSKASDALARRTQLRTEQARLERQMRLLPLVAQRRQYQAERGELGQVSDLPRDSEQRRLSRERARDEAGQRLSHEQSEMDRVRRRIESSNFDPALLDIASDTLDSMSLDLGQHRKAQVDLPKRQAELKALQVEAERIFAALGTDLPFARADELRLTDNEHVRLKRLSKEKTQFDTKLADAAGKLKKAESSAVAKRKELQQLREPPSIRELSLALARAGRAVGHEEGLPARRARLAELEQRIATLLASLTQYGADGAERIAPQQLPTLPVPTRETLAHFERTFEHLDRQRAEFDAEALRLSNAQLELEAQRSELEQTTQVPTRERLVELRAERDAKVRELPRSAEHESALLMTQALVVQADAYADRLFDSANAVARRTALQVQAQALGAKISQVASARLSLDTERARAEHDWRELWRPARTSPRSPREMGEWLHQHADGVQWVLERETLRKQLHDFEAQLGLVFEELSSQLLAVGEAPRQLWEQRLGQLLERAEQTERRVRVEHEQRADLVQKLQLEEDKSQQLSQELQELKENERVWRAEWQKALKLVGLERDAGPDEVLAVLERLNQLFHKFKEIEVMQGRIGGMQRDSERLGLSVKRLLSPGLRVYAERPLDEACETLLREARRARTTADEREGLERELEQRRSRAAHAQAEYNRAESELQQLMQRAGVSDLPALVRAEEDASRARTLGEWIAETEAKIVAMGEGATLAELVEQIQGSDANSVRARSLELEPELSASEEALDQARTSSARLEQQLEHWQAGASLVAEELASATATLQRSVKDYTRLRLAYVLLQQEIERYREENQGPVLRSASELFARLTLGAYSALRVGFDAKDQQILLCVNKEGRQVETHRLSDGARDQLYLALRVASLERYLEKHTAVPLVLDDILVHFDDARAGAALEVLGELSTRVQILFFTHHHRMVELARARLAPEVLCVHELATNSAPLV